MNFVKCINNQHLSDVSKELTVGKIYHVIHKNSSDIVIINDSGFQFGYMKERFSGITDEETVEHIKVLQKEIVEEERKLSEKYLKLNSHLIELEKKIKEKQSINLASRWSHEDGDEYMICHTGYEFLLVNLRDGKRWTDPKKNIEHVFGRSFDKFTKISN